MSQVARRRGVLIALTALVAACTPEDGGMPAPSTPPSSNAHDVPLASAGKTPPRVDVDAERSPQLVALTPVPGRPGVFDAELSAQAGDAERRARLTLALADAPMAYRRSLAFSKLAEALGARVVPNLSLRRLRVGELGALLENHPESLAHVRAELSVQNDGTTAALLGARPPKGAMVLDPKASAEIHTWESWASSAAKVPGEDSARTRDVVEMLVLDYLAATVSRRAALFDPEHGRLLLLDNDEAFPLRVDYGALAMLLSRLRTAWRFPRGLRDALVRFDRARARAIFEKGPFGFRLLPPRSLIELEERRATVLSLIEAKIAAHGEAAVLSL